MRVTKYNVQTVLDNIDSLIAENCESKTQFYEESGISSSLYSQWNTGAKLPSLRSLSKIADYFDVTVDWLLRGDPAKTVHLPPEVDDEAKIRQAIRERPELRILFNALLDTPTSEVLSMAAQIMRYKEQNQ